MYAFLLNIHNILRWAVLLAGFYAIIRALIGLNKKEFSKSDNTSQVLFVMFCHTQLLIGLILYFISPNVKGALNSGEVMKNAAYRFIAVEHIATMIIAILLIQIGRSLSKKAVDTGSKHKKALLFFSIGFILILSRIPWERAFWIGF